MAKITFVEANGEAQDLDVQEGWTLMQAAVRAGIDGIEAECGGSCACATCHCFIDEAYVDRLPAMASNEDAMLDNTVIERAGNSRLACQVTVTAALDGMTVHLPERQS